MEKNVEIRERTIVLDAQAMAAHLHRMAWEIAANHPDIAEVALLGILRRGRPLADRLALQIGAVTGVTPQVGSLATTLYRDDFRSGIVTQPPKLCGETHFDFSIDGRTVVLVDDVLAAGRTIRAAMDEVMDYGRPRCIQLACLIDRHGRELPIQPDYCGWAVSPGPNEWVRVRLAEMDGSDEVYTERHEGSAETEGV